MNVINKLKLKITLAIVIILSIIFGLIVFAINFLSIKSTEQANRLFLTRLVSENATTYTRTNSFKYSRVYPQTDSSKGDSSKGNSSKGDSSYQQNGNIIHRFFSIPYDNQSIRNYFTVKLNSKGNVLQIISDFPLHYTDTEINDLIYSVFASGKVDSTYQGMRYMIAKKPYGYLVAFTEVKSESNMQRRLLTVSLQIYAISMLLSVIVAWLFANWAVKPVQESFDKQRRFVADASHELKTPLSVISANVDVLSSQIGENKWIDYIKNESNRMNSLIKDLLYLAKTDDVAESYHPLLFDLSRTITKVVLPFESVIFDQNKTLQTNIQENIMLLGVEKRIEQLLIILIDNAIKYSEANGVIKIGLKTSGSKKIISVYNSGEGISQENIEHIFERFYRTDSSRNRESGGFGLGLSIAESIVKMHHGKIQVSSQVGRFTEFTVTL